ncbi:MAG: exo-alpha-sialidase [Ignavibacteriae bacterium]|nr:exo-alpha-sialidase [Ignavibacteriota bacterium]
MVNNDVSGSVERSPIMKIGRDGNIYISWIKANSGGNGDIYFTHSTDKGNTFFPATKITQGASVNSNFQRAAKFVIDTKGTIHMIWLESRINNQPDVWYIQSSDKGLTWTQPKNVIDSDDSSKYAQDFCSIAVDSLNKLYVSFLDSRETQRKQSSNVQLYMTMSTDGGNSWSKNKKVNKMIAGIGGTCECCKQEIEVSPEGHVYIAFRSNINNRRDIWVCRSMDGGETFEDVILIQDGEWTINACPVTGPNVALDMNENLHLVWRDNRDISGISRIYYAMLPKDSNAASGNIQLSRESSNFVDYPNISIDDNSDVAIVYQTSDKGMHYYFGEFPKSDFSDAEIFNSNGRKEFVNVKFASDGTRYLCWQDSRRDNGDIYFAKDSSSFNSVTEQFFLKDESIIITPNPVSSGKTVNLSIENNSNVEIKIYDILGNQVFSKVAENSIPGNYSFILPDLKNGIYCLNIISSQIKFSKILLIDN